MNPRTLTHQDWHRIALNGAWFAGLPSAFAAALLDAAEPISLSAGQRLFARGDPPNGLHLILRGVIRVTAHPQHWRDLGQLLAQKLRLTFASVEELSMLPPTPRVAGRLLLMAGGYGAWTDRSKRAAASSEIEPPSKGWMTRCCAESGTAAEGCQA